MRLSKGLVGILGFSLTHYAFAFENSKVLPKSVRNITIKSVSTSVSQKSNADGELRPLAEPLEKEFTFQKVINNEVGTKQMLLKGLLLGNFANDESLGKFSAEMKGNISVVAPVISWGLSERLTLAAVFPYYRAKMGVELGFQPSENAKKFMNLLHDQNSNQTAKAREVTEKINDAVGELNKKLNKNGFASLENWEGSGLGDVTIAGKYRFMEGSLFQMASTSGVILPTGRNADPDIQVSMPFGDGSYNIFSSVLVDETLGSGVFFNQYAKYYYQVPSEKEIRLKTADEAIEVEKSKERFKLGDKYELGASLQFEPEFGFVSGVGYTYFKKFSDRYDLAHLESKEEWQKNTYQKATHLEAKIGYSSVPAFKRKEFPVPMSTTIEYKKHLQSKNTIAKDLVSFDMAVFF